MLLLVSVVLCAALQSSACAGSCARVRCGGHCLAGVVQVMQSGVGRAMIYNENAGDSV